MSITSMNVIECNTLNIISKESLIKSKKSEIVSLIHFLI